MPITEAFTNAHRKYARVNGWELWPQRKSLDGKTWLCRWCAKPLSDGCTSYCSSECSDEIAVRGSIPATRRFAIERAAGKCEGCGVVIADLEFAFEWYDRWCQKHDIRDGVRYVEGVLTEPPDWPVSAQKFRIAAGFNRYGHLWEVNHIKAIAEGGDPVDPANWEVLCLRCHKQHTKSVVGRLAKGRKKK